MPDLSFERFKREALADPKTREEYDKMQPEFELKKKLIAIRKKAGLTQDEMAELLSTNKSNISRLENVTSTNSPSVRTLQRYAKAAGYDVKISFPKR